MTIKSALQNKTLLEIVEIYPSVEATLRMYDHQLGFCLLCNHLFETLEWIAQEYSIDLEHWVQAIAEQIKEA